jgi:ABC-type Na+ efflux pump permease subunit
VARREGSLELLLTTPLRPDEIVEGQAAALRAQFRPVRLALLGLFALMMLGGG